VRLGTADAIDAGIRDTPPYGKSASQGQMRQRNCSNARPMAGSRGAPRIPGRQFLINKAQSTRAADGVIIRLGR
jgi:hypothetical protein